MKPLLLLVALLLLPPTAAAAGVDWSKAWPVSVVTTEYRFSPNRLSFRRGIAYRLHLENHGAELHEFTAPEFFKAVQMRSPDVLNADRTEIAIQPGKAKDFFFVPQRQGKFALRCADHDWAGMTGEITVE